MLNHENLELVLRDHVKDLYIDLKNREYVDRIEETKPIIYSLESFDE